VADHPPDMTDWPAVHASRHRDLRLDACRGLALWFIFIDQIGWEIYATFLILLVACFALVWLVGGGHNYLDETNPGIFFRDPDSTGENSLQIYCLGVLLSFIAHVFLIEISGGVAMQVFITVAGIVAMVAAATLLTSEAQFDKRGPRLF
jgi:hypothetical protein